METRTVLSSLEKRIFTLRGQRVMLSSDLAKLCGVRTDALVQAVKRNIDGFPWDFMFQLRKEEYVNLKSQIVVSRWRGVRRALPYAFTEHGVAMLSGVLRRARAVEANIEIMRVFVRLRRMMVEHSDLARRLDLLESKYDKRFRFVFDAIRRLMEPPLPTCSLPTSLGRRHSHPLPCRRPLGSGTCSRAVSFPEPQPPGRRIGFRTDASR